MAYQVDSACYPTIDSAAQVSASKVVGSIVNLGTTPHVVGVGSISGQLVTYTYTPVGGGAVVNSQFTYTAQPCGLLDASDALAMGWGVITAWIAAYALLFITRALRGETGGDYGNA